MASIFHFPCSKYNYTRTSVGPITRFASACGYADNRYSYRLQYVSRYKKKCVFRGTIAPVITTSGKSGSGKSALLSYMARQDICNGEGVCVVDPHGDLIDDLLLYIPKERAKDVIIFDPSDVERPMGLNILEAETPAEMDLAASQATEIFITLFGDEIFGPRIQHYFRNACLTLMEDKDEGATLIDVPRIFVDDAFLKYKVKKVTNPVVKSFWEHEYANTGDRERRNDPVFQR